MSKRQKSDHHTRTPPPAPSVRLPDTAPPTQPPDNRRIYQDANHAEFTGGKFYGGQTIVSGGQTIVSSG